MDNNTRRSCAFVALETIIEMTAGCPEQQYKTIYQPMSLILPERKAIDNVLSMVA